jgi:hypothetical protein
MLKICDFGLCCEYEPENRKKMCSVGTSGYMARPPPFDSLSPLPPFRFPLFVGWFADSAKAPEVWRSEAYDYKADVFSFGVMAAQLTATSAQLFKRRDAFDAQAFLSLVRARVTRALTSKTQMADDTPEELKALVLRCTAEFPADRPTAAQLVRSLEPLFASAPPPPKLSANFRKRLTNTGSARSSRLTNRFTAAPTKPTPNRAPPPSPSSAVFSALKSPLPISNPPMPNPPNSNLPMPNPQPPNQPPRLPKVRRRKNPPINRQRKRLQIGERRNQTIRRKTQLPPPQTYPQQTRLNNFPLNRQPTPVNQSNRLNRQPTPLNQFNRLNRRCQQNPRRNRQPTRFNQLKRESQRMPRPNRQQRRLNRESQQKRRPNRQSTRLNRLNRESQQTQRPNLQRRRLKRENQRRRRRNRKGRRRADPPPPPPPNNRRPICKLCIQTDCPLCSVHTLLLFGFI